MLPFKVGDEGVFAVSNITNPIYHGQFLKITDIDSTEFQIEYFNHATRKMCREWIKNSDSSRVKITTKGNTMKESFSKFLKDNSSILYTVAVVLVVDHLAFGGAFREKIKSLVEGLLNNAQKQLDKKE